VSRKALLALSLILVATLTSVAQTVPDKVVKPDPQAIAAAAQWLAIVDSGRYAQSYWALTARIRAGGQTGEQEWVSFLKARRAPLGRPISRALYRARFNTTIPVGPDGRYEFLDYKTKFQRKAQGLEIVTLTKETGQWEMSGYHFK